MRFPAYSIIKADRNHVRRFYFDENGEKQFEDFEFYPTLTRIADKQKVWLNNRHPNASNYHTGDLIWRIDTAFMVEHGDEVEIAHQGRVAYVDLESDSSNGVELPAAEYSRIYIIGVQGLDGKKAKFYHEDEAQTIRDALAFLQQYGVLIAHNGREYDWPWLKKRCEILKIPVMWEEFILLDSEDMHESLLRQHEDSYSLDNLAKKYLKRGKIPFNSAATNEAWKTQEGRDKMAEYCANDVDLLAGLDAMFHYADVLYRVCNLMHCPPAAYIWRPEKEDGNRNSFAMLEKPSPFNNSISSDCGILYTSRRRNPEVYWPGKPDEKLKAERKKVKLPGAQNIRPVPGLYNNVLVLDYDSLYPRIIISMNLGAESIAEDGDLKGLPGRFKSSPPTVMAEVEKETLVMRDDVKRRLAAAKEAKDKTMEDVLKAESDALKIVANSIYGICGSPASRYFEPLIQSNIIFFARAVVNYLLADIERRGMEVVYGDTDSLMLTVPDDQFSYEAGERLAAELTDIANNALVVKHGSKNPSLKLKLEKLNKAMLFRATESGDIGAKKSYAYMEQKKDGSLDFKTVGIEKSNVTMLKIAAMKAYYRCAMELGTFAGADDVLEELKRKVMAGEFDHAVFQWVRLKKVQYKGRPAQVVAHETLAKWNATPEPGEPVGYVIFGSGKKERRLAARVLDGLVYIYDGNGPVRALTQAEREMACKYFIDPVKSLAEDDEDV